MIFKKLFRPKYQDPNPKVRIQAIALLSPDESEQKTRLHELAFNDEDHGVNIAALERLNSFALWSKVADTAKAERVKKKAQSMVESSMLGDSELKISDQERVTFVKECKSIPLLEKLIALPWIQKDYPDLLIELLSRINKPNLNRQVMFNIDIEQVQLALAETFADVSTLTKLQKKTQFDSVKKLVESKLVAIELARTRPGEIEKSTKLILSQLLALRDKKDLLIIQQEKQRFTEQFLLIQQEFDFLALPTQQSLIKRFEEISERIDGYVKQLEPDWQSNRALQKSLESFNQLKKTIVKTIEEVSTILSGDISTITMGEVEAFEETLQSANNELNELLQSSNGELTKESESLFNGISQCRATLERLPEFQKAVERANEFLEKLAALPLPNDISQIEASYSYMGEQKTAWQEMVYPFKTNWPESLSKQWQSVNKQWRTAISDLKEKVRQDESRCRAKLKAVDRLIEQGKFKAAIGLYSKIDTWYSQLPEKSQGFLNRSYTNVKEQVENLKDWQQYISRPRKPALLDEAIALTTISADGEIEIKSLSNDIKRLRSEWSNLGVGETEADEALNKAFELAIEKAFEPCRQYYAELENQREQNLSAKQIVLDDLQGLSSKDFGTNPKVITDSYVALQKRWREIGKIDYKILDEVNEKYRSVTKPIKEKINSFYQLNAQEKQNLIDKTKKLLELTDLSDAVDQAKSLQRKWKDIAHAGPKVERQLWNEFRSVNDAIFAKRQEVSDALKKQDEDKNTENMQLVSNIAEALAAVTEISQLDSIAESIEQARTTINETSEDSNTKNSKSAKHLKTLSTVSDSLKQKRQEFEERKKTQYVDDIFNELVKWDKDGLDADIQSGLPNVWQQCFKQTIEVQELSRIELTVMMEILSEQPTAAKDADLRKSLQLKLMTSRLQDGEDYDVTHLFQQWIKYGPVKKNESSLLKRAEQAYRASAWR